MSAKFHHNIPLNSRDRATFTFPELAKPRPMKNDISQSLGLDLDNINVYAEVYQNIPLSSRDNAIFIFQNSALGKASTDDKCHFALVSLFFRIWTSAKTQPISSVIWQSHGVHLVNINVYAKFHHNIPLSSRDSAIIIFFRIWSSAKPRPMKNIISQSLGLDLVNINVYATVYQNIPLSLRDRAIFTFSEFGARQSLDWWLMSFCKSLR